MSVPDYPLEQTVDFKFTSRAFATGVPTTLSGTPVIQIYEDNSLTQITGAETLTVDFDGVTGLNNLRVVMTAANGLESGKSYHAVISTGTVGGTSVVGEVVQQFSIERSPALRPATTGRTLIVESDGVARADTREWLGTAVTLSLTTNKPEMDLFSVSDDVTPADNMESQYDGVTGLTGDTFPATQAGVGSLASGGGGLKVLASSVVITTGTETSGTVSSTEELDGTVHTITNAAGTTDFYYEFDVGTIGVATSVIWDGFVNANADTDQVFYFDWASTTFKQIGSVDGQNGTTVNAQSFELPIGATDDDGTVRIRFESTDSIDTNTDRILVEFTRVAAQAIVFAEGTAQSGGANTIQLESGDVAFNNQFVRARVTLISGIGAGQENIITDSVAATDTLTVATTWNVNPDSTTEYVITPGQTHSSTRNGGYDGEVHVDTLNGTAGTQIGVSGTSSKPVDNLTDAYVIAADAQVNTNNFKISTGSAITLPSDSSNKNFTGLGYTLALNGQNIAGARFTGPDLVSGTGTGLDAAFFVAAFGTVTLDQCSGQTIGFVGTFTIGTAGGSFNFGNVGVVGDNPGKIDFGSALNSSEVFLQDYTGGNLEILNAGAGTGTYKFEMSGKGDFTINANCSDTTVIVLRGNIDLMNNSAITTITQDVNYSSANVNAEVDTGLTDFFTSSAQLVNDIWDEDIVAAHGTADTGGFLLRAVGDKISDQPHDANLFDQLKQIVSMFEYRTLSPSESIGQIFKVDPVNGATFASGARGGISDPLLSIQDAHDNLVTANKSDVIELVSGAVSGATTHTSASAITISKERTKIRGPGLGFIVARSTNGDVFTVTGRDVQFLNFSVNTSGAGSGKGIQATGASALAIVGMSFEDTRGDAINLSDCEGVVIAGCLFKNVGLVGSGNGVVVTAGTGESGDEMLISNNLFSSVQGDAIKLDPSGTGTINDVRILGNFITNSSSNGVNITGSGANRTEITLNLISGSGSSDVVDSGTATTNENNEQWAKNSVATEARLSELDPANLPADIDEILVDTTEIGVAGVGLTNLGGMSTGMKAEVEVEANDALVGQKLDHLVAVADGDDPVDGSIMAHIVSATEDWSTFIPATDSLEASQAEHDSTQTTLAALNDISADEIWDEPIVEPTGIFAWASATPRIMMTTLGVLMRNEISSDSDSVDIRNDADSANLWTYSSADTGTVYTSGEAV